MLCCKPSKSICLFAIGMWAVFIFSQPIEANNKCSVFLGAEPNRFREQTAIHSCRDWKHVAPPLYKSSLRTQTHSHSMFRKLNSALFWSTFNMVLDVLEVFCTIDFKVKQWWLCGISYNSALITLFCSYSAGVSPF